MKFTRNLLIASFFLLGTLLVINGLLEFADLQQYDREFAPKSAYPVFVPGTGNQASLFVTNPHFQASLNIQSFPIIKQPGTTRIFVIGGSAAFAWPYTEQYGFSGYLRRVLDRFAPGKFEVINAAGMSYGSHRVLDVLRDIVLYDPDLVIVLSGNNEYVERNVLPTAQKSNDTFARVSAFVDDTNLYRAVRLGLYRSFPGLFRPKGFQDLTDLRADPQVVRGVLGRSVELDNAVRSCRSFIPFFEMNELWWNPSRKQPEPWDSMN